MTAKATNRAQAMAEKKANIQNRIITLVDNFSGNLEKIGYELTGDILKFAKDYTDSKNKDMLEFLLQYASTKNDKLLTQTLKKIVIGMSGAFVKIKGAWLFDIEKSSIDKIRTVKKNSITTVKIIFKENQEKTCRQNFAKFAKAGIENVFRFAYTIENAKRQNAKTTIKVPTTNGTVTKENLLQLLDSLKKDFQCSIDTNDIINALANNDYTLGIVLSKETVANIKAAPDYEPENN